MVIKMQHSLSQNSLFNHGNTSSLKKARQFLLNYPFGWFFDIKNYDLYYRNLSIEKEIPLIALAFTVDLVGLSIGIGLAATLLCLAPVLAIGAFFTLFCCPSLVCSVPDTSSSFDDFLMNNVRV